MKPKYSIGEIVRIKATGERVTILGVNGNSELGIVFMVSGSRLFWESELKPYRPSRTGKFRNENGQFVSQYNAFEELLKPVKVPDSKQRNYQKIEKMPWVEGYYKNLKHVHSDLYIFRQFINELIDHVNDLEKKIDELNNKGTVTYEQGLS